MPTHSVSLRVRLRWAIKGRFLCPFLGCRYFGIGRVMVGAAETGDVRTCLRCGTQSQLFEGETPFDDPYWLPIRVLRSKRGQPT